jgi:hypothetical protein
MLLYALTIFCSAFLLFQVQPIIARMILPWFGGSGAVWAACMLFFQVALLLGYLYAHWSIRCLRPNQQAILHVALLGLSLLLLPIAPNPAWKPIGNEDPVLRILGLLGGAVGLPYFLLSTTGPLVQAWYARTFCAAFPYRLFALSNLGSMVALLSYPFLVEPHVAARNQSLGWSVAFGVFAVLGAAAALDSARKSEPAPAASVGETPEAEAPSPGWPLHLLWMALAACASTLLLAVTNHVCQNVAAIPFLWILPLALYLLSFILCFHSDAWYRRKLFAALLAVALGSMCYALTQWEGSETVKIVIPLFSAGLFIGCMFCHGELARLKPHARYLTSFYLMVSFGGALGGLFVGGLAPRLFRGYFELPVGIFACALLGLVLFRDLSKWMYPLWAGLAVALVVFLSLKERDTAAGARLMVRNFYGGLRVTDSGNLEKGDAKRTLVHGTITHGLQMLAPELRRRPTTYYGKQSGVGLAIEHCRRSGERVGVIGLGVGTLASYGRPGDYYRFYEINPLVIQVARREFSYLNDCQAKLDVVLGDARLSLERELPQNFDVLAVDAFSSDSIPVHLLTREAFSLYFGHLKPEGVLAVHISNNHLDLAPVVQSLAAALHKEALLFDTDDDDEQEVYGATWVLLTGQPEVLRKPAFQQAGSPLKPRPGLRLWTDDYSNLFQILK